MILRPLCLGLTLLLTVPLRAAPTPEERKVARVHYEKAVNHFNLGEYADAAEEFRQVYRVAPQPVILYDAAQAYRLANNNEQALTLYESFLRQSPSAPVRAEVERRILELRAKHDATPASAPQKSEPQKSEPQKSEPQKSEPQKSEPQKSEPAPAKTEPPASAKTEPQPAKTDTPRPPLVKAPDAAGGSERLKPVSDIIKANRKGFRDCFDKWSNAHPGVAGKVKLSFYLDPDGNLDQAEAEESGFSAPEVAECIEKFAGTLKYPASPSGKFTRFNYPFDFKPAR
jgi:tetratricopeptide (TPR) repeat protein